MDASDSALLGVAGVVAATVVVAVLVAGALFGFDESVARPFALLAAEPFAWIVVVALVVAVLGHSYLE
ncbi:hypothetical protein GRS48_03515 [Halorubrum sp. JWXQ-INN 858]|uniref:hypothetical protein n=1 Tax=Halorubrum sp. JWXQ-INN 858 TaxID=2690782 RepID=UPI00135B15EC|nr:hypothetical protein [Halorubrum sp. JWXQ-INN 858]MWV63894.1 hypothetical protein [Halorubrum sp. JWXQ-INN 858]